MDSERHDLLAEIYLRVCDLAGEEQARAVEEACREHPGLRGELEALLEHDRRPGLPGLDARERTSMIDKSTAPPVQRIAGYEVLEQIGEGGMGTVWKAWQPGPRRTVALKLLHASASFSRRDRVRFEREIELAAQLVHPHIARVYDSGTSAGVHYYAMELIDGVDLARLVAERKLDRRGILQLMQKVCAAVQHAHERGIIHRDLKPSNILVSADGAPHILDFGLAKTILGDAAGDLTVSSAQHIVGTPAYMSPEQASGRADAINTRSDVYALGVILFRLLTGRSPHDLSGSHFEVMRRIAEQDVPPARRVDPSIDGELEALLAKAMARQPEERYSNAGELARDIENYLIGAPIAARAHSVIYIMRRSLRRYRAAVITAVVVLALLAAGASAWVWSIERERQRTLAAAERAEAHAYGYRVQLAMEVNEAGQPARARELLNDCPERFRDWEWHYLFHRVGAEDQSLFRVGGFSNATADANFSPDGTRFVVALSSEPLSEAAPLVFIHDTATGKQLLALTGHTDSVYTAVFTPDGKHVLTGSRDETIRTFDAETGELLRTEPTPGAIVFAHCFSPDGTLLASAGDGYGLVIRRGDEVLHVIGREGRGVGQSDCVAFSPDGRRLAWTFRDWRDNTGYLWLVDVTSGEVTAKLSRQRDAFPAARFTVDGREIITGGNRGFSFRDPVTGQITRTIGVRGQRVFDAVPINEGDHLLTSGMGQIQIWDAASGARLGELSGGDQVVQFARLAISPDGRRLLSQSPYSAQLRMWAIDEIDDGIVARHPQRVLSIALGGEGDATLLASAGADGQVLVHELHTKRLRWSAGGDDAALAVAVSRDGRFVAAGWGALDLVRREAPPGRLAIFDAISSDKLWDRPVGQRPRSLDLSPDGRWLAVALTAMDPSEQNQGGVLLLDAETGGTVWENLSYPRARAVAFSPDGRELAVRTSGTLAILASHSGQVRRQRPFRGNGDVLRYIGHEQLCAVANNEVFLVRTSDLEPAAQIPAAFDVRAATLHPSGRRLAIGTAPTISIVDVQRKRLVLSLDQPAESEITDLLFTSDGSALISAHTDGLVRTW